MTRQRDDHQHTTVLMSDLSGYTRLTEAVEVETVVRLIQRVKSVAYDVVGRHGGVISQWRGDGMTALFGYPEARENKARYAIEAALELHRRVRRLDLSGLDLPEGYRARMHSGIETGPLLIAKGDPTDGKYDITGSAINLAAGLSVAARADQILVSEHTLQGIQSFFVTSKPRPLRLKTDEPVLVYEVTGTSGVRSRYEARARVGLTRFVGRERELARMQHLLNVEVCTGGKLRVLAVSGDAGVGKTRLVEEFLDRSGRPELRILRGFGEDHPTSPPLAPFRRLVAELLDLEREPPSGDPRSRLVEHLAALDENLATYRAEFGRLLGVESAADRALPDNSTALVNALAALLTAVAAHRPLVLFIDDWQWLDDASRQVVAAFTRDSCRQAVLVVLTVRDYEPVDPVLAASESMTIDPLADIEAERIIHSLIDDRNVGLGIDNVVTRIREQAGGNPLFIEELCQSLKAPAEVVEPDPDSGADALPHLIWGLIQARVGRLPEAQRELVRAAAVIGDVVPVWLLEKVLGRSIGGAVDELAPEHLIFAGQTEGTLRFKHGLTRSVIYQSAGLETRRALHGAVARALEESAGEDGVEAHCEALAHHYFGAHEHEPAARYSELAARRAEEQSFMDRARLHYARALECLAHMDQTPEIQERWVSWSKRWPQPFIYNPDTRQLPFLARTVQYSERLGDRSGLAQAHYWVGFLNYALGDQRSALAHLDQSRVLAEENGDDKLAIQVQAARGQSLAARTDYARGLELLDAATSSKRAGSASGKRPPVGYAYAMACKALVLGDQGRFPEADACIADALDSVSGWNHAIEGSIRNIQCAIRFWQGHWDRGLEATLQARKIAERSSLQFVFAMCLAMEGYGRFMQGEADSLGLLMQATAYLERRRIRLFISLAHGWACDALSLSGESGPARAQAARALWCARRGERLGEAMACRTLAREAARNPERPGPTAEVYLERAMASARTRSSRHETAVTRLEMARLRAAGGSRDEARELLTEAIADFTAMDMRWHRDQATRLARALD